MRLSPRCHVTENLRVCWGHPRNPRQHCHGSVERLVMMTGPHMSVRYTRATVLARQGPTCQQMNARGRVLQLGRHTLKAKDGPKS